MDGGDTSRAGGREWLAESVRRICRIHPKLCIPKYASLVMVRAETFETDSCKTSQDSGTIHQNKSHIEFSLWLSGNKLSPSSGATHIINASGRAHFHKFMNDAGKKWRKSLTRW
jgi:hypothetical protein